VYTPMATASRTCLCPHVHITVTMLGASTEYVFHKRLATHTSYCVTLASRLHECQALRGMLIARTKHAGLGYTGPATSRLWLVATRCLTHESVVRAWHEPERRSRCGCSSRTMRLTSIGPILARRSTVS